MKTYYVIETLNGNLRLKESASELDSVEIEIYAVNIADAKEQFKQHKKDLK
jgi:hypothetical protein